VTGQGDGFSDPSCSFFEIERYIATKIGTSSDSRARPSAPEKVFEDGSAKDISKSFEDIANVAEATRGLCPRMPIPIVLGPFLGIA
jgi:hypothetical protein